MHDKAKSYLENFKLAQKVRSNQQYSSKFREVLLNSRSKLAEHALFNQNKSILELQNQIPQTLHLGLDQTQNKQRDQMELKSKAQTDAIAQVDKIFRAVEKKLILPKFPGIVEDSLKCQIFGQFGQNYGEFTKLYPQNDK